MRNVSDSKEKWDLKKKKFFVEEIKWWLGGGKTGVQSCKNAKEVWWNVYWGKQQTYLSRGWEIK